MLNTLFLISIILVLGFRWPILGRFLGKKNMYLFDAVLFTFLAAWDAATALGPYAWINYFTVTLCVFFIIISVRNYLILSNSSPLKKNTNV